ncbi:MAG: hypothetical protein PF961_10055 [Planctomycetota bacterium]|jgi:hypothetical protein|nr:hypothetical protein [Planctomycetota bacterium]
MRTPNPRRGLRLLTWLDLWRRLDQALTERDQRDQRESDGGRRKHTRLWFEL